MTQSYLERELKFDVGPEFRVPDVSAFLPSPGGQIESAVEQVHSDYFDTPDRALTAAHMTLRRRTGTADTGWQLKVPAGIFREEIRVADSTGDKVPHELKALLLGVGRGQALVPIASITTQRTVTRLRDQTGALLAEIADDAVHASASPADDVVIATRWREVEVELGQGDLDLLVALGQRLRQAGAHPSASSSKLARALTTSATPAGDRPARLTQKPSKSGKTRSVNPGGDPGRRLTSAEVVGAYLAEQQQLILAGDLALRRGDNTVIHPTRVATRRWRGTLRTFGSLFDAARAAALDAEMAWYAAALGQVRDCEVLHERLDTMLAQVPDSLLMGPVRARVDAELNRERIEYWDALQRELTGARYQALVTDIDAWVRHPPLTAKANRPASEIAVMLGAAERKVAQRLRQANATGDLARLHRARKSAKRARYAAEAAEPVIGVKATAKQVERYRQLQDLLGEHQDSLLSAELLRRLGATAGATPGENGFAFGIMHEREAQNARAARDRARRVAKKQS